MGTEIYFNIGTLVRYGNEIYRVRGIGGGHQSMHCSFEYVGLVESIPEIAHIHDWKTFRGLGKCVCVAEPKCFRSNHPYGMFDDCGDHNA